MSDTRTLVAGRYRLGAELGRGGMGVVWEAYDELLHRTVAVKEVHFPLGVEDEERERLARRTLREARAVAAVENPHAVRVFDIVEQDGRPWIVMELVRGQTLTDAIRERGALPAAQVARIGAALADALAAAHAAGVLHRDVKPSNVILGEGGRVALTDFGIATVDSDPSDVTTSGQIVGSPAYMAPERARGERPTPGADLWSLGATLWTAAEGRPPYAEGNAFATMAKVVTEEPPPCDQCDGELGRVIGALMSRDVSTRPTAADAVGLLERAATSTREAPAPYPTEPLPAAFDRTVVLPPPATPTPAAATPTPAPVPAPPPPRRQRSFAPLLLTLGILVVAAAVIAAVVLSSHSGSPTPSAHASASTSPKASASGSSGSASSPPASPAAKSPAATTSAALPSGWKRYTNSAVGWSIGLPPGWNVDTRGSETYLRDGAGGRYLQVDTKYPAGPSAKGAWEDQERSFRASHQGYQRITLDNVSWRDYPDVADWEFTYRSGAVTLHAVDRGAVIGNRGYGLFFQTHADQWGASQDLLKGFYASFAPAGG